MVSFYNPGSRWCPATFPSSSSSLFARGTRYPVKLKNRRSRDFQQVFQFISWRIFIRLALDDLMETKTCKEQAVIEAKVSEVYESYVQSTFRHRELLTELWRDAHVEYLEKGMGRLSPAYVSLDSSRPWICYWILHSLALLGEQPDDELQRRTVEFLRRCEDPLGGYCGGPGQMPHMATTYAAVCALATIGGGEALASINREKVLEFLLRMKDSSGGFRLHEGGEMDVRGCYTAISVAYLLDILVPPLVQNVGQYIASCQTYEGGIGAEPGVEAQGGYTFCGLAAAIMTHQVEMLDLPALLHWVAFRQGRVEGGFQGRANKLVDGCYSLWQGGVFPMLQQLVRHLISQQIAGSPILHREPANLAFTATPVVVTEEETAEKLFPVSRVPTQSQNPFFNANALQGYLLVCCQVWNGGLIDKPGKPRDFYHTCYGLSGLSAAQHSMDDGGITPGSAVLGPYNNLLEPAHPLLNIQLQRYEEARDYFCSFRATETR